MIRLPIKKLFRRCLLIVFICVATGCSNFKQVPASSNVTFKTTETVVPVDPKVESTPNEVQTISNATNTNNSAEPPEQTTPLAKQISLLFKISVNSAENIVKIADKYAHEDFPKQEDILAIIAVESKYNPRATLQGCYGLMQIQQKSHTKRLAGRSLFNPSVNIEIGSAILREYYLQLKGNKRSAILSYNAGVGNFLKRRYKEDYYRKYLKQLSVISK